MSFPWCLWLICLLKRIDYFESINQTNTHLREYRGRFLFNPRGYSDAFEICLGYAAGGEGGGLDPWRPFYPLLLLSASHISEGKMEFLESIKSFYCRPFTLWSFYP